MVTRPIPTKKYMVLHRTVTKRYGKATCCWNTICLKKSVTYNWSNISGRYLTGVPDWWQLCKKCHALYDFRDYVNHPNLMKYHIIIDKNKGDVII